MTTKLYTFTLFCVLFLSFGHPCIFANGGTRENISALPADDYGLLIEKVFRQSPVFKKKLLEYAQEELSNTVYKFRWIPRPLIDSAYAGNFYMVKSSPQMNTIKAAISLYQALPTGILFHAQAEQFFGIEKKKTGTKIGKPTYEYDFNSSAGLSIPLYAAAPFLLPAAIKSELKTYTLLSEKTALELSSARKKIRSEAVSRISSYLLLKERIAIEEKRENLRQKEASSDNALWETGSMSSFELSERTTKRYEQYLSLLQLKENLCALQESFYEIGLTEADLPLSIDSWLTYWNNFILKNRTVNGLKFDAEEKRLTLHFYNTAEQGLSSLPKINLSAQAAPHSGTGNVSGIFTSSIRGYWKQAQKWDWSLHASMKISLFPFDREYLALKEFSLARQQYNNEIQSLNVYRKNNENRYKNRIELLQKLSEKAEREKNDARNKAITAEVLCKQGYLNETSFAYQKLNALLAENNYKEIRLNYISTVLEGY